MSVLILNERIHLTGSMMEGYLSILLVFASVSQTQALNCVCIVTSCDTCGLNVRAGPSTLYQILGQAYPNECMVSTNNCPGGWCQVEYGGQTAYVGDGFVSGPQTCGHPSTGNCFGNYCGNSPSVGRGCDGQNLGCGFYGASRGSRLHYGSDVQCSANDAIYAPFNGNIFRQARPYGDSSCCDDGFVFKSTDPAFPNYEIKVFYADGYSVGVPKVAGEQIATHIGLHCGCYGSAMTDNSHVQLYIDGSLVDPTSFLYCNFL